MEPLCPSSCGAETGRARNAQLLSAATVTMMTSPSVAMEELQEAEQVSGDYV